MKRFVKFLILQPAGAPALSRAHAWFEPRAFHVALLLGLVAFLNFVDLLYTLFAHRIGLLDEMNPVAQSFLSHDLEPSLISYKLLLVLAGSTMLYRMRRSGWAVPACWILIAAYSALAIVWYLWVRDVTWSFEVRSSFAR